MPFNFIRSLLFLFLCISVSFAHEKTFNIIEPKQKYISHEGFTSIVIQSDKSKADYIEINNNNKIIRVAINKNKTHYCTTVDLSLGSNTIWITAYKNKQLLKKKKVSVYFTSTLDKKYKFPPMEYEERFFHNNTNEAICKKCHDMSLNELDGVAFKSITDSNCYACHKSITNKKHDHEPAVNWSCTSCHNGKVGRYNKRNAGKSKYIVPDPIANVCFSCHKEEKEIWKDKRFQHSPVDSGRCNKCHNTHSSDEEYYLKKPEFNLCVGCHQNRSTGKHIVSSFEEESHPIQSVKDTSRPGKDLSCVSCHNPHNSNTRSLIYSKSVMGLCTKCHKK